MRCRCASLIGYRHFHFIKERPLYRASMKGKQLSTVLTLVSFVTLSEQREEKL
jgi:hypothetical protein